MKRGPKIIEELGENQAQGKGLGVAYNLKGPVAGFPTKKKRNQNRRRAGKSEKCLAWSTVGRQNVGGPRSHHPG